MDGALAGLSVVACGFLGPAIPYPLIIAVLLLARATRSMQFTALATLAFADEDAQQRSSATTISSMSQQQSMVLGLAFSAGCLNLSQLWRGAPGLGLVDFQLTLFIAGAATLLAALSFLRLPWDVGTEVSGYSRAPASSV